MHANQENPPFPQTPEPLSTGESPSKETIPGLEGVDVDLILRLIEEARVEATLQITPEEAKDPAAIHDRVVSKFTNTLIKKLTAKGYREALVLRIVSYAVFGAGLVSVSPLLIGASYAIAAVGYIFIAKKLLNDWIAKFGDKTGS